MNTSEDDKSASSDSTNETTDEQKNTIEFRHRSEDMNIAPKEVPVDPAPSRRISGPQTAAPPVQGNSADGEEVSTGNIDKIRNIIFGDQMRNYEKKFRRLEDRLNQELADLREETKRHFNSLETHISREFDSLVNRLRNEQDERSQSVHELEQEMKLLTSDLDQKLSRLDNSTSETQRDLRQQILDQSKALRDELRQKHQEMIAALERESKDLTDSKVSRGGLATLLTEVAMHLNADGEGDE
ncbi:MAG: hypothetical protein HOH43_00820 [Candidatus Latescibacteria bacterium]|nr:hypothetical protein [Candidatus Latescibacterota bacterium]